MDVILLIKAAIMGVVEGLTEFLPVSSTGHLIVAGDLINFWTKEKADVFEIVIQLAAILAVCWEFRARIKDVVTRLPYERSARKFVINLFIAFLPAAILGVLFIKKIKEHLFNPVAVATALVLGGLVILWAEKRQPRVRVHEVDEMSYGDALKIGLAQALALIPGTSRSGATIIGGLLFGLSRKAATEFSFFLAIPVMFAATAKELWGVIHPKAGAAHIAFTSADWLVFGVGCFTAFISAFIAVRGLLRFVSRHDFSVFAWYRVVFGGIILATWYWGIVSWAS
ncbi:undecaprenyl-diphosphate phosphatase [Leeia sp. TBRC 13508]|uniref:Undecaprenyl-diphosphatase n=1 Tax=Leeia speluncae TaxID=2884804 RepID=A0ABS8D5E4_9NEIS|nr:undecaprenyl-diphosphate phosphatase [Leeia speluncae]MCB6183420.1 undecaprenyl-diphosphate phosphatase [Leeia speluncae]